MIFIPAKFKSSRLPEKNFKQFFKGFSLLQISIIRSVKSNIGPVVVSSENTQALVDQIRGLPEEFRQDILIHSRPEKLARDPATIIDTIKNFLLELKAEELPENICIILPTSPFNSSSEIVQAWQKFKEIDSEKLLSISESFKPPYNAWVDGESGLVKSAFPESPFRLTQSTSCPKTYFSNGCISIYTTSSILDNKIYKSVYGYKMRQISGIDIDYEFEYKMAQILFGDNSEDIEMLDKL